MIWLRVLWKKLRLKVWVRYERPLIWFLIVLAAVAGLLLGWFQERWEVGLRLLVLNG